jgi:hypothetical protein
MQYLCVYLIFSCNSIKPKNKTKKIVINEKDHAVFTHKEAHLTRPI